MQHTLTKHPNDLYMHFQFKGLLLLHDEYKKLTLDKVFEHERWQNNFDHFLRNQVKGQFDVSAWMTLVRLLLLHYNANSYQDLHNYFVAMRLLHIPMLNVPLITKEIMEMTDCINITLNEVVREGSLFPDAFFIDVAVTVNQLATDKLIIFNSMHIANYLNYWMIKQKTNIKKDIHIFIEESIITNELFTKYVMKALEKNGLNIDLQLIFV